MPFDEISRLRSRQMRAIILANGVRVSTSYLNKLERCCMEPLDTDLEYVRNEPRPINPASRFNAMLILPILGVLLVLVFISAAIFQFDLSGLIDTLIGLMMVLFVVMVAMLFWALAPRANKTQ